MAACGTPLVAVSRAKVKWVSSQRLAGNYVVIRNKKLHQDYMYAHLATRASVSKGQVVQPGQQVGIVGADRRRHGLPPPLRALGRQVVPRGAPGEPDAVPADLRRLLGALPRAKPRPR